MDSSRIFVPSFIKKIDRNLLLKSPSVWSTRTHLVWFFGFSFAIVLALFCILIFRDARQDNGVAILTGFVSLICGIGFIFWLIYLLRFNVFKRYGNWVKGDGIRTLGLFFLNIILLVAIPFIPMSIESFMANRQYSKSELIKDVNELNVMANKLEYDKLPDEWERSTLKVVDIDYYIQGVRDTVWGRNDPSQDYVQNENLTTFKKLQFELDIVDSVVKMNDTLYYTFKCPVFQYVKPYNLTLTKTDSILSDIGIYKTAIQHYVKPDRAALLKRIEFFKTKYFAKEDYYDYGYTDIETDYKKDRIGYINSKYSLNTIESSISRIDSKQEQFFEMKMFALHFICWFTLSITLLLFVLRHTTIKTFFLTALAGVVLAILSGLFIGLTNGRETTVFSLMLIYYIIFAIIAFSIFPSKTRSTFQGIALNIFLLGLPVMPLIITALYFAINDYRYYDGGYQYIDRTPYLITAEIIGFALVIILIEPLYKKLYRSWFSAAEE
jgi:hypothetical protein